MPVRKLTITEQGLGHHWRRVRRAVLERDGWRCHWCGGRATTVDHVIPRALGGARYDQRNLVASCVPCNLRRGGRLGADVRRRGEPRASSRPRRVWAGAVDLDAGA